MEKNRIRPMKSGKSSRMSYSRQKEVLQMPNLIEVQKDSYDWFLKSGLKEVFEDISPITDYSGKLSLELVDFTLCEDDVKYSIDECRDRDATYAAPLKVRVRLYNKETDEINEHEIFMGDLPLMTRTGTFVINGAERVIVSQLVRSPGIYYAIAHDKLGKKLYSSTVIPNRGAWLEYETDSNDVFYVRVDRTRKVPVTVLVRALGYGTNPEIIDLFGEEPKMNAYFITRAGKGVSVERQKAYKYEALAAGFRDRKIDPFIVTVEPAADDAPMHLNCHPGQEMNYVLEGRLLIGLNGKEIVLNTGDSLYFDSGLPHGMKALDGKTVRFLAIIM